MTYLGKILKLGKDCGLTTCGEAILNMNMHMELSSGEFNAVVREYAELHNSGLISLETKIEDMEMLMKE